MRPTLLLEIKDGLFAAHALLGTALVAFVALGVSFVLIALGPQPASEAPLCLCEAVGTCGTPSGPGDGSATDHARGPGAAGRAP